MPYVQHRDPAAKPQATNAGPWPWNVSSIRATLTEAVREGANLALRCGPELLRAAADGPISRGQVPEEEYMAVESTLDTLTATAEERFADCWTEEVAGLIDYALEAAVVMGLRAIGAALEQVDGDYSLVRYLPLDVALLEETAADLLVQVVEALVSTGTPIPGSQEMLDRLRPAMPVRILASSTELGSREVRTDWIRNHDDGSRYQWCVRRSGSRIAIGRRRAGERKVKELLCLQAVEADLLIQLVQQAADGWQAA